MLAEAGYKKGRSFPEFTIATEAAEAGAFDVENSDDTEASEDYDWFRSEGGDKATDDYNEVFDNDPGYN